MQTIMIKTTLAGPNAVATGLTHPLAPLGEQPSGAINWAITHCPAGASPADVLQLFRRTAIWRPGDYRVRYDELGDGRLVRGAYDRASEH